MDVSNRTILIGVDGATFDLIDPWLNNDILPEMNTVGDNGYAGVLRSTIPTKSIPAWPSFNTGKNPGRHGLMGFDQDLEYDESRLVDQDNLRSPRFWDVLAANGIKSTVVGGLLTYPPRDTDGVIEVSGPMTPATADVFTVPASLSAEIRELVSNYSFGPELNGDRDDVEAACLDSVANRATVTRHLLENRDWNFCFTLFIAPDRAQHKLWKTPDRIRHVYEEIDEFVGWAREQFPDANIVLVSDHGFTDPPERDFFVNAWLSEFTDDSQIKSPSLKYGIAKSVYSKLRQRTGINLRAAVPEPVEAWITGTNGEIKSPSILGVDGNVDGIFVDESLPNQAEKIDEIIKLISNLSDSKTGRKVFQNVWRREDLYDGKYVDELPHVVLLPNPEYHVNSNPHPSLFDTYPGMDNEAAHDAATDGILMASGPDIASVRECFKASLVDVPATILHLYSAAIPTDFDGRVLTKLLTGESADREIERRDPFSFDESPAGHNETRNDVEDRLEDLGYL